MAHDTCPFCGNAVYSVTSRRLTPDVQSCRDCGDKILPILQQVSNEICSSIVSKQTEDGEAPLSSILRGMLDDELNIYMDDDARRKIEASL